MHAQFCFPWVIPPLKLGALVISNNENMSGYKISKPENIRVKDCRGYILDKVATKYISRL